MTRVRAIEKLEGSAIHVWDADLRIPIADLDRYWEVLSANERQRAVRFYFDVHRHRFVAARGILRELLGRYTGMSPASIEFVYGPKGKPSVSECGLHFNVAHCEDLGVFAFSSVASLGIDVERIRPIPDMIQIAKRFFSPIEFETISGTLAAHQEAAFFRCWTRKEAIIKATGEGLGAPLSSFDVSAASTKQIVVVGAEQRFFLYDLGLWNGYAGAVACGGPCAVHIKGSPEL